MSEAKPNKININIPESVCLLYSAPTEQASLPNDPNEDEGANNFTATSSNVR